MTVLHDLARAVAADLSDIDRKQLRFNEIVETAKLFYGAPEAGVRELTQACDRNSPLYVGKQPMWQVLREQYGWMIP
ncbi:MAG: hypothetical protein II336_18100 [Loktanella sp.]|nr:hypothetical protein [Loktanella sp.]